MQSVISREKDPFQFGVFSVGAIQGGTGGNIIPDSVVAARHDPQLRQPRCASKMHDGIRRTAKAAAVMAGAPEPEVKIIAGGDAVINDAALVQRTEAALKARCPAPVMRLPPITPSEDFAEYVNAGVPCMFFLVGVLDPKDVDASLPAGRQAAAGQSLAVLRAGARAVDQDFDQGDEPRGADGAAALSGQADSDAAHRSAIDARANSPFKRLSSVCVCRGNSRKRS